MNIRTAKSFHYNTLPDLQPNLWVSRYADYLYAFTVLRINNETQARDLVQETFLAALENVHSFAKKSTEKTWLTGILKNKICDFYRTQFKYAKYADQIPDQFFRKSDGHWNVEHRPLNFRSGQCEALENKERRRILLACIRKLPRPWQTVFMLKHREDLSSADICDQLNLTAANFWVIIHRAKVNLRACLQKNL